MIGRLTSTSLNNELRTRTGTNVALTGQSWSNPNNITTEGVYATTTSITFVAVNSDYLDASNFGFAIPSTATILGIEVKVSRASSNGSTVDNVVQLDKGTGLIGTNKAKTSLAWPATFAETTYGGPTDLWGTTWTPAEINNSNFSVLISAVCQKDVNSSVDWVNVIVWYTPVAPLALQGEGVAVAQRASSTAVIDPWNVPILKPQSASALTLGTGTFSWTDPVAKTITTGLTSHPSPGWRWINFDGEVYGLSYDGFNGTSNETAQDTTGAYVISKTKLLTATISGSSPSFTAMTNAPQGAFDLEGWEQRIWLLGGVDTPGGGTTHSGTTIFYSNPIVAGGGNAAAGADWKDPVAGTTNQIKLDGNSGDPGVGLASAKNGLVILRRNSIWVIRGSTSANYTATQVAAGVGCIDARSIVKTDQGIYFVSQLGCMVTDGAAVRNVSGPVMNTLQRAIAEEQKAVFNLQGGYVTCALTSDSNLLVSIGTNDAAGNTVPIWCALFDRASNSWVRITSSIWTDNSYSADNLYPGPVFASNTFRNVYGLSTTRLASLDGISYNAPQALYDLNAAGVYVPIPAAWGTTPLVTGQSAGGWRSRTNAQMKRYFADYTLAAPDLAADVAWSIQPLAADSSAYDVTQYLKQAPGLTDSSVSVIGSTVKTATERVQRSAFDCTKEVVDMAFVFSLYAPDASPTPPNTVVAELYGVGAEHQKTRDLR